MTGISFYATDHIGDENMKEQLTESLAKDFAQRQRKWDPVDHFPVGDITLLSKTLLGPRAPPISKLQDAESSSITAALDVVN